MTTFDQLWQLFLDRGALATQRDDTAKLWSTYTPEQQRQILVTITNKLNQRRFVHFNPLQAIRENARHAQQSFTPPTNYNGSRHFDRLVATGTLVTAEYNGQVGIYTLADANKHHMRIIKNLQP